MPTWPGTLPTALMIAGLQRTPQANVISFGTEVGPGKVRRRSTARTETIVGSIIVTATQYATFQSFFQDDLQDGALAFDWTDPLDDSTCSFRFDPNKAYSASPIDTDNWSVSLSLIKQP